MMRRGYLILESGRIFEGVSFGKESDVVGEVVFNTGMLGYPESLTDPSYKGQILVNSYPLIGNYGVPGNKIRDNLLLDFESEKIQVSGLIVGNYSDLYHHWQSSKSLGEWLVEDGVPALTGVDTRSLTKIIRETGVMRGAISFLKPTDRRFFLNPIRKERLVPSVSGAKSITYGGGGMHFLLLDCGVKLNIIRSLINHGIKVTRVPWNYHPFAVNNFRYDAIIISNGPGDPKDVPETIETTKISLSQKIPIFGICLGNQILALAAGADTYKLKYGHRGHNQPVKETTSGRCYVTSQNHGYSVKEVALPSGWRPWFINLNDSTNEGIRHNKFPFYSVQFHPEASPGPTDTSWIFPYFIKQVKRWKQKN